jgi:hypothetical protein
MNKQIATARLRNQHLTRPRAGRPEEVVAWLGAVQAQEYPHAKWGLAQRLRSANTDADIERACDDGRILRTHVLRPTWHFVAAEDLAWMLALTAPRLLRTTALYNKRNGLDERALTRALSLFERSLRDGRHLTRAELRPLLAHAGIPTATMQLWLLTLHAELHGVICSGPRRGRHATYALIGERAPKPRRLDGDEAIAELTHRYFRSHGPATIRDFVWWSGVATSAARRGLDIVKARSTVGDGLTYWTTGAERASTAGPAVYLLPIYDEYVVAYRDRMAVPHGPASIDSAKMGSVTFQHALVCDGAIAGTWRTVKQRDRLALQVTPLRPLRGAERRGLAAAGERYAKFVGVPVSISGL